MIETKIKEESLNKENQKPKSTESIRCKSSESIKGNKKYLNSIKNFKKSPPKTLLFPEIKEEDNESDVYS